MNRLAMNTSRLVLPLVFVLGATLVEAAPNTFSIPNSSQSGQSTLMAPIPAYTDAVVLLAGVSQTQAVPATSNYVVFSATCDFYAASGASVAVPVATTVNGTAPQLDPTSWWLQGNTQISVISTVACVVTMSFYN